MNHLNAPYNQGDKNIVIKLSEIDSSLSFISTSSLTTSQIHLQVREGKEQSVLEVAGIRASIADDYHHNYDMTAIKIDVNY